MQEDLGFSSNKIKELVNELDKATKEIASHKARVEVLQHDKDKTETLLELSQEWNRSDLKSFNLTEDAMRAEMKEADDAVKSLT